MVLALLIGLGVNNGLRQNNTKPVDNSALNTAKENVSGNKANGDLVKVIRVIDGDTIEIEGERWSDISELTRRRQLTRENQLNVLAWKRLRKTRN